MARELTEEEVEREEALLEAAWGVWGAQDWQERQERQTPARSEVLPPGEYSPFMVCTLSGATPAQLRYWGRLGLVQPSIRGTDGRPGRTRLYDAGDIEDLREIVDRLREGESLQRIRMSMGVG